LFLGWGFSKVARREGGYTQDLVSLTTRQVTYNYEDGIFVSLQLGQKEGKICVGKEFRA
jgi:hypothetical protein